MTLPAFEAGLMSFDTKPDGTPVTYVDLQVEQALRAAIADARADDGVLGEEGGKNENAGSAVWVIDPLDGTKRFVRGVPAFATLIALEVAGELAVGVASAPALGRRWWAAHGLGAFANDKPIRVSAVSEIVNAHLEHGSLDGWIAAGDMGSLERVARTCALTSSPGDFLMYMQLAEGQADMVLDPDARYWDLAAPAVILREAGGDITDLRGRRTLRSGSACASNGLLHAEMMSLLLSR